MSASQAKGHFRVAATRDFLNDDGSPKFQDMGLDTFANHTHIEYEPFADHRPEIGADQLAGYHGVIVLTPTVTAQTVSQSKDLLTIGRFGVGYDAVDVEACTQADVLLFITAGAVDRPVAEATVMWMLALSHRARIKDRLVRTGEWDERSKYMGSELRDRTLGVVGLGGIGGALVRLLAGFGMNQPMAHDPYVDQQAAQKLGVKLVELDELVANSDFVSLHCPLTDKTRNLIDRRELALMRSDAYLINAARGGVVNEDALYEALDAGRIAGAALDCFEVEPVTTPHRFGNLDNVLLAPHSIAWTHEMFRDIGRAACQGMVDLSLGKRPRGVVNSEVFDRPGFQAKWERLRVTP